MGFDSVRAWTRKSTVLSAVFGTGRLRNTAAWIIIIVVVVFAFLMWWGDFSQLPQSFNSFIGFLRRVYGVMSPLAWIVLLFFAVFMAVAEFIGNKMRRQETKDTAVSDTIGGIAGTVRELADRFTKVEQKLDRLYEAKIEEERLAILDRIVASLPEGAILPAHSLQALSLLRREKTIGEEMGHWREFEYRRRLTAAFANENILPDSNQAKERLDIRVRVMRQHLEELRAEIQRKTQIFDPTKTNGIEGPFAR